MENDACTVQIRFWRRSNGESPVQRYIGEIGDADDRLYVNEAIKEFNKHGLGLIGTKRLVWLVVARQSRGLLELRPRSHRIVITILGGVAWLLHAFKKQGNKTPSRHIKTAQQRAKSIISS